MGKAYPLKCIIIIIIIIITATTTIATTTTIIIRITRENKEHKEG